MGSLFAGIGGFDLGFERAGFEIAWHSEIDKAASAILAYRWPGVPNLGDVTKIDGAAIPPVDVICGGFPCQDLSVAGKRRGFEGERSVLAFEFLRIVAEMREATDGRAPAFVVLENVPGLFSSRGGRDFGALLDALVELGPMDLAWRVLDSRYFGVAQRRRRVFVVVDFGGERCDEILALTEGLRGDSPARGAEREAAAEAPGVGAPICGAVSSKWAKGTGGPAGDECYNLVAHSLRADGFDASEDGTGRGTPLVPVAFNWQSGGDCRGLNPKETTNALHRGQVPACIPFDTTQVTCAVNRTRCEPGSPAGTLAKGGHPPAVAMVNMQGSKGNAVAQADGPSYTLNSMHGHDVHAVAIQGATGGARGQNGAGIGGDLAFSLDTTGAQGVAPSGVRRLTPRECERLQGFPGDWTAIPGMADGPRYKCLGNAVTVNVAEWIGKRLTSAASRDLPSAGGGE